MKLKQEYVDRVIAGFNARRAQAKSEIERLRAVGNIKWEQLKTNVEQAVQKTLDRIRN